jgi:hypothetical protein
LLQDVRPVAFFSLPPAQMNPEVQEKEDRASEQAKLEAHHAEHAKKAYHVKEKAAGIDTSTREELQEKAAGIDTCTREELQEWANIQVWCSCILYVHSNMVT